MCIDHFLILSDLLKISKISIIEKKFFIFSILRTYHISFYLVYFSQKCHCTLHRLWRLANSSWTNGEYCMAWKYMENENGKLCKRCINHAKAFLFYWKISRTLVWEYYIIELSLNEVWKFLGNVRTECKSEVGWINE